jgi:ribosomal protein L15
MELYQIKPKNKSKKAKRLGRGGVHGFACGRGFNGQASRSGNNFKPIIREVIKRYHKLRGYKFNVVGKKPTVLNFEVLEKNFESGSVISPKTLLEKRIIRRINGVAPKVKVLAKGDIKKSLIFENVSFSENAKKKIEKAGGEIKNKEENNNEKKVSKEKVSDKKKKQ